MLPSLRLLSILAAVLLAAAAVPAQEDERARLVVGALRSVGADSVDVDGRVLRVPSDVPMSDLSGRERGWGDLRAHVGETIQVLVDNPAAPRPVAEAIMLGPPPR